LIKDEFLQQNSFSTYDYNCPLYKTLGMMKILVKFYEGCLRLIIDSSKQEKKISMGFIVQTLSSEGGVLSQMKRMKKVMPTRPEHEVRKHFDDLLELMESKFRDMQFA
jgi:V-type H+-transporting ATPase subunit A